MNNYNIIACVAFVVLFMRIYLSYRMDCLRSSDSLRFKFLFGAYAFDAVMPVLRKAKSASEARLRRLSNWLFLIFWTMFLTVMLIIWVKYR